MQSVSLNLNGAQLSDLFFNYEHPARDAVYVGYANQKDAPTADELTEAALSDAKAFIELYQIPVTPATLADDFLSRV